MRRFTWLTHGRAPGFERIAGRVDAQRRTWRTGARFTPGTPEGEVLLARLQRAAATGALESHTLEAIAAGVSTCQRADADPVAAEVPERAT